MQGLICCVVDYICCMAGQFIPCVWCTSCILDGPLHVSFQDTNSSFSWVLLRVVWLNELIRAIIFVHNGIPNLAGLHFRVITSDGSGNFNFSEKFHEGIWSTTFSSHPIQVDMIAFLSRKQLATIVSFIASCLCKPCVCCPRFHKCFLTQDRIPHP